MIKIKLKAFFLHLLLSLILVSLLLGSIIYYWFPLDYLGVTNFKEIATLIITIDLVLGPVLTFIIFNPGKKGLRFDLVMIALFQLSALSYATYALYLTHPLFITFKHDSFNVVNANEVNPQEAKYKQFKVSKLSSGHIAFAKMPDDPDLQAEIMAGVDLKGEPDIDKQANLYEPISKHLDEILAKSLDPDLIFSNKKLNNKTKEFKNKYKQVNNYAYLPLIGAGKYGIVVIDKKTSKLITTIETNPLAYARSASK